MKQKNIKILIIPFISIGVFTLIVFAAGYAYFMGSTTMVTSNYQVNMPAITSLICSKTDCSATVTPAMMTNTNYNATVAKVTNTCAVNCTCSGTQGAVCNYNVTLLQAGSEYVPSSGLGSNKEFTVKVISPSGCTTQNSSSTETQVNTQVGKIVSKCSLTVPAGGSVSANVSAEFKFYNLNLDQTSLSNNSFNYELTTANRQTIYRNSTQSVAIGDNISTLTSYETNPSNISKNYYLKHIVENDVITESYVCYQYIESGDTKISCVRGGDGGASYGTYDGMSSTVVQSVSGATGNIKNIQDTQNYFEGSGGSCYYSSSNSSCFFGDLTFGVSSGGSANCSGVAVTRAGGIGGGSCGIQTNGISYCT